MFNPQPSFPNSDKDIPDTSDLKVLKDLDFRTFHGKSLPVHPSCTSALSSLIATVNRDSDFLCGLNIMDYSILLIIIKLDELDDLTQIDQA